MVAQPIDEHIASLQKQIVALRGELRSLEQQIVLLREELRNADLPDSQRNVREIELANAEELLRHFRDALGLDPKIEG